MEVKNFPSTEVLMVMFGIGKACVSLREKEVWMEASKSWFLLVSLLIDILYDVGIQRSEVICLGNE